MNSGKTMIFSKIFKIFCLFLLLAAFPAPSFGAFYRLNEHTEVRFSPTAELFASTVMEYIRELDLQLSKFFPGKQKEDKSKIRKFRIYISDDDAAKLISSNSSRFVNICISGITPSFQSDYNFLHRLFSAAALQSMPYETEDVRTSWQLPHWISLALHAKLKSSFSGTKIVRSSRTIPAMRFFLEKNYFPDPLLIERMNAANMSNIEFFFMQDYCRFLVELATAYSPKNSNLIGSYLRELYLENTSSDQAIFQRLIMRTLQDNAALHLQRLLDDPEKYTETQMLEKFFRFNAGHMAFSYSSPAPVSYLEQYFKELQKVRFAELDKKNKPKGKIINSTIDQLPVLIRKYPYMKTVIQLKKGELLHFRSISSSFFSEEINHLIELVSDIQNSYIFGTTCKEINSAIKNIEDKIRKFAAIEEFLEKTEAENLSPFQVFPYEFSIEKEHRNAEVPASLLRKLEQIEKSYLK